MKKRSFLLYALSILVYLLIWQITSNSYNISRDELWYASYSLEMTDEDTDDIRHITEVDMHQVAFLKPYRIMQSFFIGLFGKNIFGLRFVNLFFLAIALSTIASTFNYLKLDIFKFMLFLISLQLNIYIQNFTHLARPEVVMSMLSLITLSLWLNWMVLGKKRYLYLSISAAILSLSVYWNGVAVLFAIFLLLFLMGINKKLALKDLVILTMFSIVFLSIILYSSIGTNIPAFIETFTNDATQAGNMVEGAVISRLLFSLPKMFWGAVHSNLAGNILFLIISMPLAFYVLFKIKSKDKLELRSFGIVSLVFLLAYLFVVSFRAPIPRFLYHILPLIHLSLLLCLSEIYTRDIWRKPLYVVTTLLFILLSIYGVKFGQNVIEGQGQWKHYTKWKDDLEKAIGPNNGRIMAMYDFTWALEDYKLFQFENFLFKQVESMNEMNNILKTYNVTCIVFGETTIRRMNNKKSNNYVYLKEMLMESFYKKTVVYNKYYRSNKGRPPCHKDGYATEIWVRKVNL